MEAMNRRSGRILILYPGEICKWPTITIILLEKENGFGILVGVLEDYRGV